MLDVTTKEKKKALRKKFNVLIVEGFWMNKKELREAVLKRMLLDAWTSDIKEKGK